MTTYSNHTSALACATTALSCATTAATNAASAIGSVATAATTATIAANAYTVSTAGNIYAGSLSFSPPSTMSITGENPKIVTAKGEIDLDHLVDFMKRAEEILCVVKANQERLERYPALQEAYDHYRIIDALCRDDEDDG